MKTGGVILVVYLALAIAHMTAAGAPAGKPEIMKTDVCHPAET